MACVCPKCGGDKFTVTVKTLTIYRDTIASRVAIRGIPWSAENTVEYFCENCGVVVTPVDTALKTCRECGAIYYGSHKCDIPF